MNLNQYLKIILMRSKIIIWKIPPPLTWMYQLSLRTKPLHFMNILNPISCHGYSYNHWVNHHNSPTICLQCTLMETPNCKFKNSGFLIDQQYIYIFFVRPFPIPLNNQHQVSDRLKNSKRQFTSSKQIMFHPSTVPMTNFKL